MAAPALECHGITVYLHVHVPHQGLEEKKRYIVVQFALCICANMDVMQGSVAYTKNRETMTVLSYKL